MTFDVRRPVLLGLALLLSIALFAKAPVAVSYKQKEKKEGQAIKTSLLSIALFAKAPVAVSYKQKEKKEQAEKNETQPSLPETKARMYRAPDGKLYVPGSLPVTLSFSAAGDTQKAPAPAWTFTKEGKQLLKAQGQPGPPVEIYVDLTPPRTGLVFSGAPVYKTGSTTYYGKGLAFSAPAKDKLSGIKEVYLSVNRQPYKPFNGDYRQFTPDERNSVSVLAIDNVGNREQPQTGNFFPDTTAPVSGHKVTGITFKLSGFILSPGCMISLFASDAAAGVEGIYYRLDEGPEIRYKKPLKIKSMKPGKHLLTWYARDRVKNREKLRSFQFRCDNEPPKVSLEVEGPQHSQEGTFFISGHTKLKAVASDDRAGTKTIFYRIDSGKDTLYKEPILLPRQGGRHKVDVLADDNVANRSQPLSRYFYLDMSPPESDFKIGGFYSRVDNEFVIRKEVTMQLVSADLESGVSAIRYRINDQPAIVYNKPFNCEKNGRYQVCYWAEDNVGNVEDIKTIKLRVETAAAKAGFRKPPARYPKQWYRHPDGRLMGSTHLPFFLYLGLTGKDGKTIGEPILLDLKKLGMDDSSPITFTRGGINTLTINTGMNRKRGAQSFRVLIDALPPRTAISFSSPRRCRGNKIPCYGPQLEIRFSAADVKRGIVSGFKETRVSVDGSEFFTYSTPLRIFSRQKSYTVEYFSVDNVGNAEKPRTLRFAVDATPPVTTRQLSGPRSGPILSARSIITLAADDNHSGVKTTYYAFDGKKERLYRTPLTGRVLTALSEGGHTLRYYSIDRTGNKEYPREMGFRIDHGVPAVRLRVSGEKHTIGKTLYLAQGSKVIFSAADPRSGLKSIRYRVDNGPAEVYKKPLTAPRITRRYELYYNGEDNAGNISPWKHQAVVVDNTAPQTQLNYDGPVFRDKFRFYAGPRTGMVLSAKDAQSGVRHILCSVDNQPFKTVTAQFRIKRGGPHRLRFRAADNVGNIEKLSSKNIYIDNTPPVLNISYNLRSYRTAAKEIPVYPAGLVIRITAADAKTEVDKVVYRIDNGRERLYRNPLSEFVQGRNIILTVTANDRLGNRAEHTITFRVEKGEL